MNKLALLRGVTPFSGIEKKPYRTITVNTTFWRFPKPCEMCGKAEGIIAGIPTTLNLTLPMSPEEFDEVAQKPFYVSIDFEIQCNGGQSHSAKGLKPKGAFIVSDTPGLRRGYYVEDESVEKALYRFIPHLYASTAPKQTGFNDDWYKVDLEESTTPNSV